MVELTMTKNDLELEFIINFIMESSDGFYNQLLYWKQLQALWTAYCMHNDLQPDTLEYDNKIKEFYESIKTNLEKEKKTMKQTYFPNFKSFDLFMGGLLC